MVGCRMSDSDGASRCLGDYNRPRQGDRPLMGGGYERQIRFRVNLRWGGFSRSET